jgi:hypothetical protein
MDENRNRRDDPNLDEEMERDTEIRRETQVRGSLGLPPSGEESNENDRDESIPEFDRDDDRDKSSER